MSNTIYSHDVNLKERVIILQSTNSSIYISYNFIYLFVYVTIYIYWKYFEEEYLQFLSTLYGCSVFKYFNNISKYCKKNHCSTEM